MESKNAGISITNIALCLYFITQKTYYMLPETILQSDVLDILFENRNKAYGAYILRRQYNSRLAKAIMSVAVFALLIALLLHYTGVSGAPKPLAGLATDVVNLIMLTPASPQPEKKLQAKVLPPAKPLQQVKLVDRIDIVKTPVTDTIPTVKTLDNTNIGDKNTVGEAKESGVVQTGNGNGGGVLPLVIKEEPVEETPIDAADIMPQYPGGNEAFQKFMQRNLRQPDDLDAGEKIVVLVRFIVEKDGSIAGTQVIAGGRKDLDEDVLKTLQKMPKWIPGVKQGRKVAVYFKLPVTFMQQEQ